MAKCVAEGGRFFVVFSNGLKREVKLAIDPTHGDNLIELRWCEIDGTELATPFRVKGQDGGQRLAGDRPGCSAEFVIVDEENRIIDG